MAIILSTSSLLRSVHSKGYALPKTIAFIFSFLFIVLATLASAQVAVTANVPQYNFQVLAGSTRQINVNITGGTLNTINWSVLSTTGGAYATFTTPSANAVSIVDAGLPTVQVNIGSTPGNCSIAGSAGSYAVSSTASVTVQAQSVDDPTKAATFLFNVCSNSPATLANGTESVIVAPAYQQAYKSQPMTLQSWVVGCVDETGTWSITSQPSGGDGALADTTNRDTVFTASVSGRYGLQYKSNCNGGTNSAIVYVSPNPMPSYAGTPNGTRPHECYVDPALTGGDYEVGAGKAYHTIAATPALTGWTPGTIMRIWNTDTTGVNPSTFNEYYNIAKSGTPTQPIIVCGVADSQGNLPIMDGTNATAQSDVDINAGDGMIILWPQTGHYGYWQTGSVGPSYVSITGLHLRNANSTLKRYSPGSGTLTAWNSFTGCINGRSGSYVDISGNELDNCSLGLFTDDNANNAWATVTQNLTFMGNHIQLAGDPGSPGGTHGEYAQTFYGLFEGNRVDNPTPYIGSQDKWRGVEGIFRYNYIGNGAQRLLDLVENQDGGTYMDMEQYIGNGMWGYGDTLGANGIAWYQESQQKDIVYGNAMFGTSALAAVHYADDQGGSSLSNRNGTLFFYSNTLDNARAVFDNGDGGSGGNPYYQQRFDARNNILWGRTPAYTGLIQMEFGEYSTVILDATTNLMQTGTFTIATPLMGANWSYGTQEGWSNQCNGTCLWPLSVPLDPHLYGLTSANYLTTSTLPYNLTTLIPPSGSAALNAGTPLSGIPAQNPVRWQFNVATNALTPRQYPLTIGAEDPSGAQTPVAVTPTFSPAAGTYSSAQMVAISTTTPSATIYYTTNGSTPTTGSTTYSGPITVSATETVEAIAVASGYSNSSTGSAAYTIGQGQAATPTFSPAAGSYNSAQTVTISTTTPSTTIYYTTNGSTPTTASTAYSGPITVSATETVEAIAVASGYSNSSTGSAAYTISPTQAVTPTFSPAAGTYSSAQTVTISSTTPSATIYYTTNGSTPTTGSAVYSGPIAVSATETVEAIAVATGYTNSLAGSAAYTIGLTPVVTPVFTPGAGTYTSAQTVSISTTTPSATIYYTTNGSTPTTSSAAYSGPINVSSTQTLMAIATATGLSTSSTASAAYTINIPQAAAPTFSPIAGTYKVAQTVTISTTTPSATIYYTTNGSTPTTSSTVYTGPITVAATQTIEAIATASGYTTSSVGSAAYTINLALAATPTFSPAAGTYNSAQTVTISTTTPSATIYYTTNGSTPTTSSTVYSGPITVSASETVQAVALSAGFATSDPGTSTYTINTVAVPPSFNPAAGSYMAAQTVTISTTTPSATIYYTTNGTTPTTSSAVYSGPITVSATETVEAIAAESGYTTSGVSSAAYTINLTQAAMPNFSPAAGTYTSTQTLSIGSVTPSATIYYTTDGSTPTTSSAMYTGPITVSSTETVEAIATATGFKTSVTGIAAYTIAPAAAVPTFSPVAGTYSSAQTVTVSTTTPSATIYYTTNGSIPTTGSAVYSGPILVSSTETLEAIAVASGHLNSTAGTAVYSINYSPASAPTFSPAAGTYSTVQTVAISTVTPGATIYYTTNGATPTTSSPVYSVPITVSASETVKAVSIATGYTLSVVSSGAYTINFAPAATPLFSPGAGTYGSVQTVTISTATPAGTVYYTTNGSTPTTGSAVYSGPVTVSATETVQAIAIASGYSVSGTGAAAYTINLPPAATPTFSPGTGSYNAAQAVTINSATPGVTIYYTTNGSTPTTGSAVYSGPITVSTTETVEAIAVAAGRSNSPAASAAYTLNIPPAAPPTFTPGAGTYDAAQVVSISSTTPGAAIYYTTDGTTPTMNSAVYSSPIMVSSTETLEAISVAPTVPGGQINSSVTSYTQSAVGMAAYVLNLSLPNFSVSVAPGLVDVVAGQSSSTTVVVTPLNSFASPVTFSCSGLPAGTSCSFAPATVTPSHSGAAVSTTLTVTASTTAASVHRESSPLFPGTALALAVCCFGLRKRRGFQLMMFVLIALGMSLCTGCSLGVWSGSQPLPQPQSSTVTVVATSGTLQPSTTFTLTVQ